VQALNTWMNGRRVGGGWPAAWDIAMWARLERGDKTAPLITAATRGTANNLHRDGANNQIDASFGCTAGMAESLLQSHAGEISLLPALPETWSAGSVTGLRARGGYTVDMKWENSRLVSAVITNINGVESIPVRYREKVVSVQVKTGHTIKLDGSRF